MTLNGIVHVQVAIAAGGAAEARGFYGGLLGLGEIPRPESLADREGCWFVCGEQELHCGVDDTPRGGRHHPAFLTDGLEGLRGRLAAAGVPVQEDRQIPGYRRFYARDPFGNRLEFLERISD